MLCHPLDWCFSILNEEVLPETSKIITSRYLSYIHLASTIHVGARGNGCLSPNWYDIKVHRENPRPILPSIVSFVERWDPLSKAPRVYWESVCLMPRS